MRAGGLPGGHSFVVRAQASQVRGPGSNSWPFTFKSFAYNIKQIFTPIRYVAGLEMRDKLADQT